MYRLHLCSYVMPGKSSDDFRGLFCLDANSMHRKTRDHPSDSPELLGVEESVCEGAMSPDESARALALLARWALRKAQKEGSLGPGGSTEVVTVDCSKGSGGENADNRLALGEDGGNVVTG
jgi:hypothetical protein